MFPSRFEQSPIYYKNVIACSDGYLGRSVYQFAIRAMSRRDFGRQFRVVQPKNDAPALPSPTLTQGDLESKGRFGHLRTHSIMILPSGEALTQPQSNATGAKSMPFLLFSLPATMVPPRARSSWWSRRKKTCWLDRPPLHLKPLQTSWSSVLKPPVHALPAPLRHSNRRRGHGCLWRERRIKKALRPKNMRLDARDSIYLSTTI